MNTRELLAGCVAGLAGRYLRDADPFYEPAFGPIYSDAFCFGYQQCVQHREGAR